MQRRRSTLGTCFGLLAARLKPKRRCVRPRAVIRRSPKHSTIFSDLLDEQGRSEAAIECLRRALQAAPEYADAMFNLALSLQRGSRHKEAAEYWRQYLANDALSEWAARARRSLKFCAAIRASRPDPSSERPTGARPARDMPPVISTIVMLRFFAPASARVNVSVLYQPLAPPTGLGLLASPPRAGFSRSGSAWLGRSQKDGLPTWRGGFAFSGSRPSTRTRGAA